MRIYKSPTISKIYFNENISDDNKICICNFLELINCTAVSYEGFTVLSNKLDSLLSFLDFLDIEYKVTYFADGMTLIRYLFKKHFKG